MLKSQSSRPALNVGQNVVTGLVLMAFTLMLTLSAQATAASSTGAVQFSGDAGAVGTDNNLFWDNKNKRLGIGTATPIQPLHVYSSGSGIVAEFQNANSACTLAPATSSLTLSCSSDIRLKKDIVDTGDALAYFGDMRIRDFTVKSSGEHRTGVIAQEMLKIHPDMVHMGADSFYKVDEPDPWKLVKAIQELKAENDNLRAENAKFEAYMKAHP